MSQTIGKRIKKLRRKKQGAKELGARPNGILSPRAKGEVYTLAEGIAQSAAWVAELS
jgi:hypothetical protein